MYLIKDLCSYMKPLIFVNAILGGVTVCVICFYALTLITRDKLPHITGTQPLLYPYESYGFGNKKQKIILELDQVMIDDHEKIISTFEWSDTTTFETHTIAIKIKNSTFHQKHKLNYEFEMLGPKITSEPCVSFETCKKTRKKIFPFQNKYEDFLLSGEYNEPTFIRNTVATQLDRDNIPNTLVDVLFRHKNGNYTYEGIYILTPHPLDKETLKHELQINNASTTPCNNHAILLGEYNDKEPCKELHLNVKMHYPPCNMETCYYNKIIEYFSILTMKNTTIVPLHYDSFVNAFLTEMLMREGDLMFNKQYFYLSPDDNMFHFGPTMRYNHDFWRILPIDSWNIFKLHDKKPVDLWVYLGENPTFINAVNVARNRLDRNHRIISDLISVRRKQYLNGTFNRNIERWDVFGGKRQSSIHGLLYAVYGNKLNLGKTMEKELDNIQNYIDMRTEWLKSTPFTGFKIQNMHFIRTLAMFLMPLIIPSVLFMGISFYLMNEINQEEEEEEEEEEERKPLVKKYPNTFIF